MVCDGFTSSVTFVTSSQTLATHQCDHHQEHLLLRVGPSLGEPTGRFSAGCGQATVATDAFCVTEARIKALNPAFD